MAMAIKPETPEVAEGRAAVEELPAAEVAYLTVRGPYTNLEDAYTQLYGWVIQHGRAPADAAREVYVRWGEETPPGEWVTEIQVPVGGRKR